MGAIAGIIGAVGSLASAGAGIAGSLMQKTPNTAEESSRINEAANKFVLPFTGMNNPFFNIDIPGMATQSLQFGIQNVPAVNTANMLQLQQLLGTALPGYQTTVSGMQTALGNAMGLLPQMAAPIPSLLAGQVPSDVQQQIQRSAAFTSLMGGSAGAGTGTTGAITARDLGLTSLDLEKTGMQQAAQYAQTTTGLMGAGGNLLQLARNYLMPQPVSPLSLLPLSDLIQGTEWQKEAIYQANLAAFTAKSDAAAAGVGAPAPSPIAGIGGAVGGLLGSNSFQQQLGKIFGGGGGGSPFSAPAGGFSGLSPSDMSSVIGGGFSSGGLEAADFEALGLL